MSIPHANFFSNLLGALSDDEVRAVEARGTAACSLSFLLLERSAALLRGDARGVRHREGVLHGHVSGRGGRPAAPS